MLGLPSIAMVVFGLAALVTRHWRHKIQRAARHDVIPPNRVHLALDPERWGEHAEDARSKAVPRTALSSRAHESRRRGPAAAHRLNAQGQAEADFVSINGAPEDSELRAAERRKAFKVISNL